jgi:tRNA (Thr-GGU) A37 N-methylase
MKAICLVSHLGKAKGQKKDCNHISVTNNYSQGWYLYNSPERQSTLGNTKIRLYTKRRVHLTLSSVDLYRHRTIVQFYENESFKPSKYAYSNSLNI